MVNLHLVISGKVQGVFFRDFIKKTAEKLGVKGWVRNNPDGTVEAIANGPKDKLEKLASECRKGPPAAEVENVKAEWGAETGKYSAFEIKH